MVGSDSLKSDSQVNMVSHKPPIITAHDADPPESHVEAERAAHPYCLLLLLQKQLLHLFLTSSLVRIFFEVLISSLQLFNLHTNLLPAKKWALLFSFPNANYPVYKYKPIKQPSADWNWSRLAAFNTNCTNTGIQWTGYSISPGLI